MNLKLFDMVEFKDGDKEIVGLVTMMDGRWPSGVVITILVVS